MHKFGVGEKAVWQVQQVSQNRSRGPVTIVSQLPPLGNVLQYRIKSLKDQHEFVVLEHELSPGSAADGFLDATSA